MGRQENPYPLRLEREVMEKLRVVAKDHGRSVNKEIEMIAREHVAAYEKENGEIKVDLSE